LAERAAIVDRARAGPQWRAWLAPLALLGVAAVAAIGYGWFYFGRGLDVPDEGLLLHVAERLASGQVPYRDVYFIYTPGLQYLLALLFRLFGPSLAVEHALQLAVHLGMVLTVYLLTQRLTRWRPMAVLVALVVVADGLSSYRFLLGLLTVGALTRYAEHDHRRWLAASGALAGLTYIFAQEVGLYALATAGAYLLLCWAAREGFADTWRLIRRGAAFAAGALLVLVPWLIVTGAQGALAPMLDATLRVAFFHQPRYMHVPLPPLLPLLPDDLSANVVWGPAPYLAYVKALLYLPFAAEVAAILTLIPGWRSDPERQRATPLVLFAGFALATLADRGDYYHLRQVLPVTIIVLGWLLARLRGRLLLSGLPPAAGWLVLLVPLPLLVVGLSEASSFRAQQSNLLVTPRGSALVDETQARDLAALLGTLGGRTHPGEAIYVWPAETAVYFLADRRNTTRFGQLVPTELAVLADRDGEAQREIIADLVAADVRWAVGAPAENVDGLPFADYAPLVADYLAAHYHPVERFGYWTLFGRAPE
jgi:hypothetical protein